MASNKYPTLFSPSELRRIKQDEIQRDIDALNAIHTLLDGTEWGSDTLEDVAEIVRETGREIHEPYYYGDDD